MALPTKATALFRVTGRSPNNPARPEALLRSAMALIKPEIVNYAKSNSTIPSAKRVARFMQKQHATDGNLINLTKINTIFDNRNFQNRFGGPNDAQNYASLYLGLAAANQMFGSAFMEMAYHKDASKVASFAQAKGSRDLIKSGLDSSGSALGDLRNYLAIGKVMDDQTCLLRYKIKPTSNLWTLDLDDSQVMYDLSDMLKPFAKEYLNQLEQATVFNELGRGFWNAYTPDIANRLLTQSGGLDASTLLLGGMPDYFATQLFGPIVTNEKICLQWKSTRDVSTGGSGNGFMAGAANLLLPADIGHNPSTFELVPDVIYTFDSTKRKIESTEVQDGAPLPA